MVYRKRGFLVKKGVAMTRFTNRANGRNAEKRNEKETKRGGGEKDKAKIKFIRAFMLPHFL